MFEKKYFKQLIIFLNLLLIPFLVCFAVADVPELSSIVAILGRILNIAVGVAGIALVVMIAYGVIKSSLATGDPRGLEGAKATWTYALYGFFIVVAFFALFLIISRFVGSNLSPNSLLGNVASGINSLLNPR